MRKIIVLAFITLDGVIQAPGSQEEDPSEGFTYGGWVAPYKDETSGTVMQKQLERADLLLGRKTFDIWENYWPTHSEIWPGVNEVTKYVFSSTKTRSDWNNCVFINSVEGLEQLKNSEGGDIKIWGSSKLIQLLLSLDMVDEFWLNIHPILLGKGKKLFNDGAIPTAFALAESTVTSSGVIMANYKRTGKVKVGRVGAE